jgi:hypothetical protein
MFISIFRLVLDTKQLEGHIYIPIVQEKKKEKKQKPK